jgi:hypothetical protein
MIDGNEIQHGSHSGHLGWEAELNIERNLSLVTPNKPQKNRINRPRCLSYNWWNVYGHRHHRWGHDIMPRHFMIGGGGGHKKGLQVQPDCATRQYGPTASQNLHEKYVFQWCLGGPLHPLNTAMCVIQKALVNWENAWSDLSIHWHCHSPQKGHHWLNKRRSDSSKEEG